LFYIFIIGKNKNQKKKSETEIRKRGQNMEINGHTRTCGLIGNPVEHTMSPVIHNTLAQETGENLTYVPFHVADGRVEDAVKGAWALNLLGLNVTVPYKSDVIPYLSDIDPLAEKIGAVNTLVRTESGFKGYNTDMPGLYRAMCEDGVKVEGEDCIILGAGGVARAVAMLLASKNVGSVTILNRTVERAQKIADEVNRNFADADKNFAAKVTAMPISEYRSLSGEKYLVIQATSVGMTPNTDEAVIEDEDFYKKVHTGYDLIFNPLDTKFMKLVRAQGGRTFCGYKMLLYQGIIAYEYWTGKTVSQELAAKVYQRMLDSMGH
jgi:shikimate dehydrogenase